MFLPQGREIGADVIADAAIWRRHHVRLASRSDKEAAVLELRHEVCAEVFLCGMFELKIPPVNAREGG